MKKRKYIGDGAFYKTVLTVALPIIIQNFITNLVSMLDNIMVGALGTEQMSGVSIENQIIFIYNLAVFGGLSGIGIFTAQFYGKKDNDGIRYTMRLKLMLAVILSAGAIAVLLTEGRFLTGLFIHDSGDGADVALTFGYADDYLKVILWGLVPFALSQVFSSTLRETGDTFTPMLAGFAAVIINCVFNYLLIFGKLGFPEMGVRGAAAATVMSRYAEAFIIIVYSAAKKKRFPYIKGLMRSPRVPAALLGQVCRKGVPLLFNEILWSSAMSLLTVAYSLHGLAVVAGTSIATTVSNLFSIAFISMGSSIGIIVGRLLGAKKYDEAVDTDRKLIAFSLFLSIVIAVPLFFFGGGITRFYNTSAESKELAVYFIKVFACVMPLNSFANASYFTLRSGGKTLITSLFDSGSLWLFSVPAAFALYYFAHLSIWWVFPIVESIAVIKDIIGFILLKKRVWVRTII